MSGTNENNVNIANEDPAAEDVMGIVNILDAENREDSEMLAQLSRGSAVIKEPDGRAYITLKAAEQYTGYSNQTLRQYYKKGRIKGIKKETAFGDTIYLELDDVKTFRAAVSTRKAAKMDSAEFALEVSNLMTSVTSEAMLPIMEKISAIEMNQIDILERLAVLDSLAEAVAKLADGEGDRGDSRIDELVSSVDEIKKHLQTVPGSALSDADLPEDGAAAAQQGSSVNNESVTADDGVQAEAEAEPSLSGDGPSENVSASEQAQPAADKDINDNGSAAASVNSGDASAETTEQTDVRQLMEDYRELMDTVRKQQEYIERQKNRTFLQRLFNIEPKDET